MGTNKKVEKPSKQEIRKKTGKAAEKLETREASSEQRQKTASEIAQSLYKESQETIGRESSSLGKLITHIIELLQAIFNDEKSFTKAFSNETIKLNAEIAGKDKVAKLKEIWPETRVTERFWINLADGIDKKTGLPRCQSFGPFQFARNTFTDSMKYVRARAPERWDRLSPQVKRKIELQTALFDRKKSNESLIKSEIDSCFLNMKEARELIAKVFKPPDLAYEYRAGQFFDRKLPRIIRSVSSSHPEFRDTIDKFSADKRYLTAIFDMSNHLGPGGASKIINAAFRDLKTKGNTSPTFNEMFISLVKASYTKYGEKRAIRTLGALAMACGQTSGKMDRKKMTPFIRSFVYSDEKTRQKIIEDVKKGQFS